MYLSKLLLNKNSFDVRRDLRDCHELHKTITTTVLTSHPSSNKNAKKTIINNQSSESNEDNEGRLLYRLDEDLQDKKITLLVQTEIEVDWGKLPENYLANRPDNKICKSIDFLYPNLSEGMQLRFHLRANPTMKSQGKRKALITKIELISWLERKSSQHGFEVLNVAVDHTLQVGWRKSSNNQEKKKITFNSALFDGDLVITHKEPFIDALKHGIGRGKGYGFGLLSISLF